MNKGPIYLRTADCAVLVFDLTNPNSFEDMEQKFGQFLTNREIVQNKDNFPLILIGK